MSDFELASIKASEEFHGEKKVKHYCFSYYLAQIINKIVTKLG